MLTITDTGTYLEITQAIAGLSAVREYTFEYSQVSTVNIDNHFLLKTTSESFSEHFDNITLVGITLGDSSAAGLAAHISALSINSNTFGEPAGSDVVLNRVSLTQAEYDAGTPVSTTLYIIVG
tara:strand:- start:43 stop:411 length:369 start_codon:yes stop_codon:yes gene_type:complete